MKLSLLFIVVCAVLRGNCQDFTVEPEVTTNNILTDEPLPIPALSEIIHSDFESQLREVLNAVDEVKPLGNRNRGIFSNIRKFIEALKELIRELKELIQELKELVKELKNRRRAGCPVGFFQATDSRQCYKFYNDAGRNWTEAKGKCEKEGLMLAEPRNPLSLRKYMVETYGTNSTAYTYLGARGTGSYFKWENSGEQISNSSSLWFTRHPASSVTTDHCLLMLAATSYLERYPNQPYYTISCSRSFYTLCEYLKDASQTY